MKMLLVALSLVSSSAFADFLGCWPTTQIGVVKGTNTYMIFQGEETLWLNSRSETTLTVLNYAALVPVQGWNLCIEGEQTSDKTIKVSEALICTKDTTVGVCDPNSRIADSRLF